MSALPAALSARYHSARLQQLWASTLQFRAPALETGLLLAIVGGALVLRAALAGRGLWLDETISFIQVEGLPLHSVIDRQVNGVHPPLYHVLLHGVIETFGSSPLAMRSLSIAWSAVAVVALFGWSREAFPDRSPLPAAALGAFAPFAVWYGTEARMYAQLLALTAVTGWLVWRTLGRGVTPARAVGLVVSLLALAFTHYLASLAIAGYGLLALVLAVTRRGQRRAPVAVLGLCVLVAGTLGAWVLHVLSSRETEALTTVFAEPDFFAVLIAGLEMVFGFHDYDALGVIAGGWPVLCLLAVVAVSRMGHVPWRTGGVLMLATLPPVALVTAALVLPQSVFDSRYLTVCVAPVYLLLGHLWSGIPSRVIRRGFGVLLIAVGMGVAVWQNHDPGNPKLYELGAAVQAVNARAQPGDVLLVVPQVNELSGRDAVLNYYPPDPGVRVVDTTPDGRSGTIDPAAAWERASGGTRSRRVFAIYGYDALAFLPAGASPGQVTTGPELTRRYDTFLRERARLTESLRFANVNVRVYDPSEGRS